MDPFYLALLLYLTAVVLAFVDLFVPSGGMLIVLAVLTAFACVLFAFRSSTGMGMTMLTIVFASVPLFAVAAMKIWPNTPIGRRVILGTKSAPKHHNDADTQRESLVGTVVAAEYPLMPSGQIHISGKRYNALVRSGIIESGERVEVVSVKERNLVVKKTNAPLTQLNAPTDDLVRRCTSCCHAFCE